MNNAASIGPQSTLYWPRKLIRPTGSVFAALLFMMVRENRNSFHTLRKLMINTVDIPPIDTGITIAQKICRRPPPSILAASRMASGNCRKKVCRRRIENGR